MDAQVITRFTIGTEQGIRILLSLTQTIFCEKFLSLLSREQVSNYLSENFNEKTLMAEVNSISNQWLVVYVNENPVGFARITSKGERPESIAQKRAVRIADFGILKEYDDPAIRRSLFGKCLSVCKSYEAIWIRDHSENPHISFFESEGFSKQDTEEGRYELPLPSVCLIKQS